MGFNPDEFPKCYLVHDWFGAVIQLALAVLSFSSLIVKRFHDKPRRTWKIWFLDASKQAAGALVTHFANIGLSILFNSSSQSVDECVWYMMNFIMDCTVGVPISYLLLRLFDCIIRRKRENWRSGDYGQDTHKPSYIIWIIQLVLWMIIMVVTKCIIALLMFIGVIPLKWIGAILLYPVDYHPRAKLVVVMLVVPVILNVIQFWVVDAFIKKKGLKVQIDVTETPPAVVPIGGPSTAVTLNGDSAGTASISVVSGYGSVSDGNNNIGSSAIYPTSSQLYVEAQEGASMYKTKRRTGEEEEGEHQKLLLNPSVSEATLKKATATATTTAPFSSGYYGSNS